MQEQQGFRFCCKVMEWPKVVMDVAEEGSTHLMQSLLTALLAVKQYKYERANLSQELGLFSSSLQARVTWCMLNINIALLCIFFQTSAGVKSSSSVTIMSSAPKKSQN